MDRKNCEKNFHDDLRAGLFDQRWSLDLEKTMKKDHMWTNMKYYSIERKSRNTVIDWYANNCKEKKVLDYCCGNGDDSIIISKIGASEVVGIDISDISINNCRERAIKEKVEKKTLFNCMDAEELQSERNYFDIVTEYGALHHLDLEKAYSEISRVLKGDGSCICTETLGHNPLIYYYRKRTPHLRTEWEVEHILCKKDIEKAKRYFNNVSILGFFHLTTLGAVPFRKMRFFYPLLSLLEAMDNILLKLPILKWQAWQTVFVLSDPKK